MADLVLKNDADYNGRVPPPFPRGYAMSMNGRKSPVNSGVLLALVGVGCGVVGMLIGSAIGYSVAKVGTKTTRSIETPAGQNEPGLKLKTVQFEFPREAFVIRGTCELSTMYIDDFTATREECYSILLSQSDPEAEVYAYIDKKTPEGKRVFSLLGGGEKKTMTLKLLFSNSIRSAQVREIISYD